MFSLLNLINQGLNYFNFFHIGSKGNRIVNRIYLLCSVVGEIYLFHVGRSFIKNQRPVHGTLILLAALILVYFIYINFFYYFLGRTAPGDVSPQIEKKLGIKPLNSNSRRSIPTRQVKRGIPVRIKSDELERLNLRHLIQGLINQHALPMDYSGMDSDEIQAQLRRNHDQPVYAIGAGFPLPESWLRPTRTGYQIYAGRSRNTLVKVGRISRIGFESVHSFRVRAGSRRLRLTTLLLTGGPYRVMGRSQMYEHNDGFRLYAEVTSFDRDER